MNINPKIIYFDSCIILDKLNPDGKFKSDIEFIESEAKRGIWKLASASITLTESFRLKLDASQDDVDMLYAYFLQDHYGIYSVDLKTAKYSQQLRAELHKRGKKIAPWDAIHIATCVVHKIEYLITIDGLGKNNRTPMLELDQTFNLGGDEANPLLRIITPETFLKLCGFEFFNESSQMKLGPGNKDIQSSQFGNFE